MRNGKLPPVREDLSFVFVPIDEDNPGSKSITYEEAKLGDWVKDPQLKVHHDPEFDTFTFGEPPDDPFGKKNPRAKVLFDNIDGEGGLGVKDLLFFFADFQKIDEKDGKDSRGFYFIGFLELQANATTYEAKDVENDPEFANNAHCRRGGDTSYVIKGTKNSMRFQKAVPLTKDLANRILLTQAGEPLPFGSMDKNRNPLTDLQVINSATRRCRLIESDEQKNALEKAVKALNPNIVI